MRLIIFFILIYIITTKGFSQNGTFKAGARSSGLADASVTLQDAYAIFNNISGIAKEEAPVAVASYSIPSAISAFKIATAGLIIPNSWGNTSISFYRFGDVLYNEQKLGLGYAHKLGVISLGAQINYIQFSIEGYGNKGSISIDIGGITELLHNLSFGAFISNINQGKVTSEDNGGEHIATIMRAGLTYTPTKNVALLSEVEKDIDYKPNFKLGVEYEIVSHFFLRSGFSTAFRKGHYGLGFRSSRLHADYALSNNMRTGNTHQLSLTYLLKKNI